MRGTVAKKIRKGVKPVAKNQNDVNVEYKKRTLIREDKTTLDAVTGVRTLTNTSIKFLAGKIKDVYKRLNHLERAKFFPILMQDVQEMKA